MATNNSLPSTLGLIGGGVFFLLNFLTDGAVPGGAIGGALGGGIGAAIGIAIEKAQAEKDHVHSENGDTETTTGRPDKQPVADADTRTIA